MIKTYNYFTFALGRFRTGPGYVKVIDGEYVLRKRKPTPTHIVSYTHTYPHLTAGRNNAIVLEASRAISILDPKRQLPLCEPKRNKALSSLLNPSLRRNSFRRKFRRYHLFRCYYCRRYRYCRGGNLIRSLQVAVIIALSGSPGAEHWN